MKYLYISLLVLFLGCGYKPASIYTKEIFAGDIYSDVKIDLKEPESSVVVKDAVNEAIITKFKSNITNDKNSKQKLFTKIKDIEFRAIEYDKDGYITRYQIEVILNMKFTKDKTKSFDVSGFHEFQVEPSSTITDVKRFEAIKKASLKAIDQFITKMIILGY